MEHNLLQSVSENLQFVLVCAAAVAAILLVSKFAERRFLHANLGHPGKTNTITICGMLGALSGILYLFDFSVPFLAPGFYKLDFSEIPVMIGAFYLGPVGGVIIELVKVLLKLVLKGTSTAFVGDLANFLIGCAFVVPASICYHLRKTKKTARLALLTGTIFMTILGSLFNAFYLIPAFSVLYGIPLDTIIDMGSIVNPAVTSVSTLALFAVAPLNLLKGILISIPTLLLYKRVSKLLISHSRAL